MTILDEIVDLAVNNDKKLSVLLRKRLVLSTKIRNDKLAEWATKELNGYSDKENIPEYPKIPIIAKGHFQGRYGAAIQNASLPSLILPQKYRDWATTAYLMQPIAAFDIVIESDNHAIMIPWPQDLVVLVQYKFIQNYALWQAWQDIPISTIVGLLDSIRNRVLGFALDMQGQVGNSESLLSQVDQNRVNQQIVNHIYESNVVISPSESHIQQVGQLNIIQGDLSSLITSLKTFGVGPHDIGLLEKAIKADPAQPSKTNLGNKVKSWIGDMAVKTGTGTLKAGTEVAVNVITEAILKYYGIK